MNNFVMGATIKLVDQFTRPMDDVIQITKMFREAVENSSNTTRAATTALDSMSPAAETTATALQTVTNAEIEVGEAMLMTSEAAQAATASMEKFQSGQFTAAKAADDVAKETRKSSEALMLSTDVVKENALVMDTANAVTVDFKESTEHLGEGMDNVRKRTDGATNSVKKIHEHMNNANHSFVGMYKDMLKMSLIMGAVMATLAAPVVGFKWLVSANADMETYKNTLTVVMGSQQKAIDQLAWAQKFAAQTPFEIPEIVDATAKLQSYGLEAKKVLGITGDMAAVMGKSLDQAVEAIADAQTGELERLKEFGLTKKMIEDQAKTMGSDPINNKGQITDLKAFNAALFTLMEKRFKGGMEMQSKTFKGMLSNIKDFVGSAGRTLGAPIFEKLKEGVGGLLGTLNNIQGSGILEGMAANIAVGVDGIATAFSYVGRHVGQTIEIIKNSVGSWYSHNKPLLDSIGDAVINGIGNAWAMAEKLVMPVLTWLQGPALTGLLNILGDIATLVVDVADAFVKNWKEVGPLVEGVGLALAGYYLYTKYIAAVAVATKAWAAAQIAVSAAMAGSRIPLMIGGVGLLIGALIYAYTHSETFRDKVNEAFSVVLTYGAKAKEVMIEFKDKIIELKDKAVEFGSYIGTWIGSLKDLKDNAIDKVKQSIDDFKKSIEDHKTAIEVTAGILTLIFGPALVQTGVKAAVAGGKLATEFIANVIKSGVEATISAGKVTAEFIVSIVKAGAEAAIAGAKIVASFVASLITTGIQAAITAGAITINLIAALIAYAARGWEAAVATGAATLAFIANGIAAGATAIAAGALAIAQGLVTGATYILTAAQWAWNAALNANPIGLVIIAITALIGIGILLYKNWDLVKAKAGEVWQAIKDAWTNVTNYLENLDFVKSGEKIIQTMVTGIKNKASELYNTVKGVFSNVRELLPFSDAHEGPFSQLTLSGNRIMSTLATGVMQGQSDLHSAVSTAFSDTPGISLQGDISPVDAAGSLGTITPVNPAGANVGQHTVNTTTIDKVVEKIEVYAQPGDNPEDIAQKVIDKLHNVLKQADDILNSGDMEVLL